MSEDAGERAKEHEALEVLRRVQEEARGVAEQIAQNVQVSGALDLIRSLPHSEVAAALGNLQERMESLRMSVPSVSPLQSPAMIPLEAVKPPHAFLLDSLEVVTDVARTTNLLLQLTLEQQERQTRLTRRLLYIALGSLAAAAVSLVLAVVSISILAS